MKTFLNNVEKLLENLEWDDERDTSFLNDSTAYNEVDMALFNMKLENENSVFILRIAKQQIKFLTERLNYHTSVDYESSKRAINIIEEQIQKLKQ